MYMRRAVALWAAVSSSALLCAAGLSLNTFYIGEEHILHSKTTYSIQQENTCCIVPLWVAVSALTHPCAAGNRTYSIYQEDKFYIVL